MATKGGPPARLTAVGAVLLVTAIARVCPAYSAFGINTGAKA